LASNPYPSRAFYLACPDGRKALAKDATELAIPSILVWRRATAQAAHNLVNRFIAGVAALRSNLNRLWGTEALAPEPHWRRRQRHDNNILGLLRLSDQNIVRRRCCGGVGPLASRV
jgi:hypothetical protein